MNTHINATINITLMPKTIHPINPARDSAGNKLSSLDTLLRLFLKSGLLHDVSGFTYLLMLMIVVAEQFLAR